MAMGQGEVAARVNRFSEGLVSRAVDLMLLSIYYKFDFQFAEGGDEQLAAFRELNPNTFKRALVHLRQTKMLAHDKESFGKHKVTDAGVERVESLVPQYHAERFWDGKLYLINYDVPVSRNVGRNALRDYLKSFGCGMLQHSVWLWQYNPKSRVEEFVAKSPEYGDHIILSSITSEDALNGLSLADMVNRVYKLSEINSKYEWYLGEVGKGDLPREQIVFKYLSILKQDPQAPFELLPEGWLGGEAHSAYEQAIQ